MRGVGDVATVDLAGNNDAQGRLLRQHRADLHRRRVGAQQGALPDVERVLHVPRRVVARNVERLEVVVVALDLRALGDREAEPREDGDDLVVHAGQGVERALGRPAARQREVEPRAPALGLALGLEHRGELGVEERLERALGLVRRGADERPLLGGERAERAQELGELALAAEHADTNPLQLGRRLRGGDGVPRLSDDGVHAGMTHETTGSGLSRSR